MNNFISKIRTAFISLMRQKSRTFLTVIAVAIGIAALIIMISAGNGLKSMVLSELEVYGANVINVEVRVPGKSTTGSITGFATGISITTFTNKDVEIISNLPNVEAHYSYVTGQEIIKREGEAKSVMIFGYGGNAPSIEKINIEKGRFYSVEEEESISSVIVLGSGIKDFLFGDGNAINEKVYIKNMSFKVVGVLKKSGANYGFDMDSIVYIPTLTLQKKILGTDYVMGLSVKVKDPEKINETKEDIIYLLRDRHNIDDPIEDDFEAMTIDEAKSMIDTVLSAITFLLTVVAAISLLVGGVGITNIMYVSVAERKFEVGLRRSIGAKKNDILWQFLIEAGILTFLGGVFGVIIGLGVSYLIYYVAVSFGINWSYSISLLSIISALVFSVGVGIFFGVYPAKKAANTDPINALRKD